MELVHAPPSLVLEGGVNRQYPTYLRSADGKSPPFQVNSAEEETYWVSKGFEPSAPVDLALFEATKNAAPPYVPIPYPMWLSDRGVVVNSEAEHRRRYPEDFKTAPGQTPKE